MNDGLPLAAYKELIGMLKHEESLFWNRIQIFLIINAAMLTILGIVSSQKPGQSILTVKAISFAICASGVAFSLLWYLIVCRSEAFYNHWYEQIKHLEIAHLTPIRCFNLADEYFEKGEVTIGPKKFTLTFYEKCARIYSVMRHVTKFVAVIWLLLGLFFLFTKSKAQEKEPGVVIKVESHHCLKNHRGHDQMLRCCEKGEGKRHADKR